MSEPWVTITWEHLGLSPPSNNLVILSLHLFPKLLFCTFIVFDRNLQKPMLDHTFRGFINTYYMIKRPSILGVYFFPVKYNIILC